MKNVREIIDSLPPERRDKISKRADELMTDDISELVRRLRSMPSTILDVARWAMIHKEAADALERLDAVANEWARVASAEHDLAAEWQKRAEAAEAALAEYQTCLGPNWNPGK